MTPYHSISPLTGKASGVKGYEYDSNSITVHFRNGEIYTYTIASCGASHIRKMKRLADAQSGLNTYITKKRPPYASKS